VVIADWIDDPWAKPFVESGSVLVVKGKARLADVVRKALHDKRAARAIAPKINKFLYEQTYKQDGRATERMVALAKRMAIKKV